MNILLIGNGFDLAHGLPTKYTDFLEFVKVFKQGLSKGKLARINWGNTDAVVQNLLIYNKGKVQENLFLKRQIWEDLINNNFWIGYFLKNPMYQKENWIDFESEISRVIISIENDMKKSNARESTIIWNLSEPFLAEYFLDNVNSLEQARDTKGPELCKNMPVGKQSEYLEEYRKRYPIESLKGEMTYKELKIRLENDLNRLINALEKYLTDIVEQIKITNLSDDIKNLNIDYVISFNYTDTYEKLYEKVSKDDKDKYDYIHGKASINNNIESNNMVLGIDEYLPDDRRNKDIEFIAFKKFYQRIHKQTGCKYKEWIEEIKESWQNESEENKAQIRKNISRGYWKNPKVHNLYIFGHSLDVTDKDILRDLILNDNIHTSIFYHNKDVMGQQIANLVKVIGQDELIRRTGGSTKTIEFVPQKPMDPINVKEPI